MEVPRKARTRRAVFLTAMGPSWTRSIFAVNPQMFTPFPGSRIARRAPHARMAQHSHHQSERHRARIISPLRTMTSSTRSCCGNWEVRSTPRISPPIIPIMQPTGENRVREWSGRPSATTSFRRNPRGSLETRPAISFAERPPAAEPSSCSPVMAANTGRAARTLSRGISSRPRK